MHLPGRAMSSEMWTTSEKVSKLIILVHSCIHNGTAAQITLPFEYLNWSALLLRDEILIRGIPFVSSKVTLADA